MNPQFSLHKFLAVLGLACVSMTAIAGVKVYGPGGPAPAMLEASKQFQKNTGIQVEVTAGPTAKWADQAKQNADIIYSGSEAMMTDFENMFAEKIVKNTVEPLYLRPAAIVVRPGNPKKINGFKDLARSDYKILVTHGAGQVGMWEDIAGRSGDIQLLKSVRKNIATYAANTAIAKEAWSKDASYDAWIVYNIWGVANPNLGDVVKIEPELVIYRDTGIAFTQQGVVNKDAAQFAQFLKSNQGKAIFQRYGWQ